VLARKDDPDMTPRISLTLRRIARIGIVGAVLLLGVGTMPTASATAPTGWPYLGDGANYPLAFSAADNLAGETITASFDIWLSSDCPGENKIFSWNFYAGAVAMQSGSVEETIDSTSGDTLHLTGTYSAIAGADDVFVYLLVSISSSCMFYSTTPDAAVTIVVSATPTPVPPTPTPTPDPTVEPTPSSNPLIGLPGLQDGDVYEGLTLTLIYDAENCVDFCTFTESVDGEVIATTTDPDVVGLAAPALFTAHSEVSHTYTVGAHLIEVAIVDGSAQTDVQSFNVARYVPGGPSVAPTPVLEAPRAAPTAARALPATDTLDPAAPIGQGNPALLVGFMLVAMAFVVSLSTRRIPARIARRK
jgi:hypothetical protein